MTKLHKNRSNRKALDSSSYIYQFENNSSQTNKKLCHKYNTQVFVNAHHRHSKNLKYSCIQIICLV